MRRPQFLVMLWASYAQANSFNYICASKHHITRVSGAATIAAGRNVLGAVQVICSNNVASPVYGGKHHILRVRYNMKLCKLAA